MSEMQNPTAAEGMQSKKQARKRAERFWWAGALIWAGLVFWADSLDLLPQIGRCRCVELGASGRGPVWAGVQSLLSHFEIPLPARSMGLDLVRWPHSHRAGRFHDRQYLVAADSSPHRRGDPGRPVPAALELPARIGSLDHMLGTCVSKPGPQWHHSRPRDAHPVRQPL